MPGGKSTCSTSRATMATTLHVTILSSHYAGRTDAEEGTAAPGAGPVHKKESMNAKSGSSLTTPSKAAGRERDSYAGSTSAEQQDSVARTLRAVLQQRQRCHDALGHLTAAEVDRVASSAHLVQLTKAVRDGALPWTELPSMLAEEELKNLGGNETLPFGGARPKLSTSSLLSDPAATSTAATATAATAAAAAAKPNSRTSSRGRGSASRQRSSSVSSRRVSALTSALQNLSEVDRRCCQAFLDTQLPPCEVVTVPLAQGTHGDAPSSPASPQRRTFPVFFLYHLAHEEEVIAALSSLRIAPDEGPASAESALAVERERRRKHASRAAALVTQALWCSLRPVLRAYLHATKATAVPSHASVVWSVADPRLLEGLNSFTSLAPGGGGLAFCPCAASVPPQVSSWDSVNSELVDRWVCLMPRSLVYLYDPAVKSLPSADPTAAAVEAALVAIHGERAEPQRSLSEAESVKSKNRRGSADNGGNRAGHKGARGAGAVNANAAAAGSLAKARGSNNGGGGGAGGRGDPAGVANAAAVSVAGGESTTSSMAEQFDAMTVDDFSVEPSLFPYCAADPTSLGCYLFSNGEVSLDAIAGASASSTQPTLVREDREKALTVFLAKAASFRRAVLACQRQVSLDRAKAKSALRVTASLLQWTQTFLSAPQTALAAKNGDGAGKTDSFLAKPTSWPQVEKAAMLRAFSRSGADGVTAAASDNVLDAAMKDSLHCAGLDPEVWPLPLWSITAVPFAATPAIPLRASTNTNAAAATSEASTSQLEADVYAAFRAWASALVWCDDDAKSPALAKVGGNVNLLMRQLDRTGRLVDSYAAWLLQTTAAAVRPRGAQVEVVAPRSDVKGREKAPFAPDSYTGGVFTVVNGVAALMAEARHPRTREAATAPTTLMAVCAAEDEATAASTATPPAPATATLFARYRQPFRKLIAAQDGACEAADTATVPRNAPSPLDGADETRVAVTVVDGGRDADVALPPYPQEVLAMVRHIIAKNAGHFEVSVTRGTDTITAAAMGGASSAMVDSTMTGSFLPNSRQAALNATTQSTGLLLRQQQQQQRRRQRGQSGSIAASVRPYVHGVRLVKEISKSTLGRRPLAEAAVLLQGALESTLSTPAAQLAASSLLSDDLTTTARTAQPPHPQAASTASGRDGISVSVTNVNALELLQRYLANHCAPGFEPTLHSAAATTTRRQFGAPAASHHDETALSAANAAAATAHALTPRVYEHCLQQVLLHQLLQEAGLEEGPPPHSSAQGSDAGGTTQDWSVTQQVPTEAIVSAIVNYRERFGAHNVALKACTLDYDAQAPSPSGAAGGDGARSGAEGGEVHRTSAYAHNALNVHPTRRASQLWVVGVALPGSAAVEGAETSSTRECSSSNLRNARKWVDMVPRSGTATSVEQYAMWRSLLQAKADTATQAVSSTSHDNNTNYQMSSRLSSSVGSVKKDTANGSTGLTTHEATQLLTQYLHRHAEATTTLVHGGPATAPTPEAAHASAAAVAEAPMRFSTHETLYPHGDALLEVWSGEGLRSCRYIKSTEVTAALHAGARGAGAATSPLHLAVRWDDGLLFSCSTTGTQQSTFVPVINVAVTTANLVLQRNFHDPRLLLRRYPNTSSYATASSIAAAQERNGQQPFSGPPQGLLGEACTLLFEERTVLCCVHDCAPFETSAVSPIVTVEPSVEGAEVSCEVDERTGVVQRTYSSGAQLLLFPSGAMLTRWPLPESVTAAPEKRATLPHGWCETLVTCDGRCFVRRVDAAAGNGGTRTAAATVLRRVTPQMKGGGQSPAFEQSESTYDTVRHCHICSRRDGLTVVQYKSIADVSAPQLAATPLARVVVFPDGTSITTLADRTLRQCVLAAPAQPGEAATASTAVARSSPSLCAMLAEVDAVERSLLGTHTAADAAAPRSLSVSDSNKSASQSVRWLIEAPTLPRFYLAPAAAEEKAAGVDRAAFAVVFGDGTTLQRHWVATAQASSVSNANATSFSAEDVLLDGDGLEDGEKAGNSLSSSPPPAAYSGGTVATVLTRPSTSAVRVLHSHALATIEPADVLATVTRASLAAYAVGQGLPFFDFAHGGGMRLVDAARCVWDVRGLTSSSGTKVSYPDRARTYEELLRELVSAHFSPHRLPRAAETAYAREQRNEQAAYARQRATGWCPPLVRRLRELSEAFIRAANLLRTDVLAPVECAAARVVVSGRNAVTIRPACFGQLVNGEAVRYWCTQDIVPATHAASRAGSSVTSVVSEPNVLQRVIASPSVGSVLRYPSSAPTSVSAAEVMAVLSAGGRGGATGDCTVLGQRLAEAQRLSLLCVGGLAPPIPPAFQPLTTGPGGAFSSSYASALPPLAVLISHGCRWLPPALQPPQQFSSAYSKSAVHAVAAQSDVVWAQDATALSTTTTAAAAAAAAAMSGAAYVQYLMERMDAATSSAMLRLAVARRELRCHDELAQLSHYHRVLTAQWPMVQPAAAREEQVRLEMRYDELQRARRQSAAAAPPGEKPQFAPSAPKDTSASARKHATSRLTT